MGTAAQAATIRPSERTIKARTDMPNPGRRVVRSSECACGHPPEPKAIQFYKNGLHAVNLRKNFFQIQRQRAQTSPAPAGNPVATGVQTGAVPTSSHERP